MYPLFPYMCSLPHNQLLTREVYLLQLMTLHLLFIVRKSRAYIGIHAWCFIFCGFWLMTLSTIMVSLRWSQNKVAYFFLVLSNFQLFECTSLFIHLSPEGHLVVFKFWQLWINLLCLCPGFLCGHNSSTPMCQYHGVWLLDHIVRMCIVIYKKLLNAFPQWLYHFAFPSAMKESSYSYFC